MTSFTLEEFKAKEALLTPKQIKWAKAKANWERMPYGGIVMSYTPPPDDELTPCGCAACYGCAECKAAGYVDEDEEEPAQ